MSNVSDDDALDSDISSCNLSALLQNLKKKIGSKQTDADYFEIFVTFEIFKSVRKSGDLFPFFFFF